MYRTLLVTGAATAATVSDASGVPNGRVYDVLNSLETYHLVRSQAASRPKKYVAVEPDTALDRLLESKRQELAEKAEQYENVVAELPTTRRRRAGSRPVLDGRGRRRQLARPAA